MTRPVGEPSLSKEQGSQDFGLRQLFRRPHPDEAGSTESVLLFAWNYDVDPTVPTNTWSPIANFAGGGGFFEEGRISPAGAEFSVDMNTGTLGSSIAGQYEYSGYVQFHEDAQVDPQHIWIAVNMGSSERVITTHTFTLADSNMAAEKLSFFRAKFLGFGTMDGFIQVYHDAGVDLTIRDVNFWLRRFELDANSETLINDPYGS